MRCFLLALALAGYTPCHAAPPATLTMTFNGTSQKLTWNGAVYLTSDNAYSFEALSDGSYRCLALGQTGQRGYTPIAKPTSTAPFAWSGTMIANRPGSVVPGIVTVGP